MSNINTQNILMILPKSKQFGYGGTNNWGEFSDEIGYFQIRARQLTPQANGRA
jgi:hypothetical protein